MKFIFFIATPPPHLRRRSSTDTSGEVLNYGENEIIWDTSSGSGNLHDMSEDTTIHVTPKSFSEIFTGPKPTLVPGIPSLVLVKKTHEKPTLDTFVPLIPTEDKSQIIFATPFSTSSSSSSSTASSISNIPNHDLSPTQRSTSTTTTPRPTPSPTSRPTASPTTTPTVTVTTVKTVYNLVKSEDEPKSIFVAGPTPKSDSRMMETSPSSKSYSPPPIPIVVLSRERPQITKFLNGGNDMMFVTPRYVPNRNSSLKTRDFFKKKFKNF